MEMVGDLLLAKQAVPGCEGLMLKKSGLGRLELPISRLSGAPAGVGITAECRKNLDGSRDLPLSRFVNVVICRVQSTGQPTGDATLTRHASPAPRATIVGSLSH